MNDIMAKLNLSTSFEIERMWFLYLHWIIYPNFKIFRSSINYKDKIAKLINVVK